MRRQLIAAATALALAVGSVAPTTAYAEDRRGYDRGYDRDDRYDRHDRRYDRRGYRHRGRDDNDEAIAAGVIGLVLGLAIGAAASQPREPRVACRDNYQRCAPPPRYPDQGYRQDGYYDRGGDQSAYERDYGYAPDERYAASDDRYAPPPPQGYAPNRQDRPCTRRERQWDRYANQYVMVDMPC